jgi:hypothetical protein
MLIRRTVASVAGLALLAGLTTVSGALASASAAAPATAAVGSVSPSIAVRAVAGQPPRGYVMPQGATFSYPNKGKASQLAIRNRVLYTTQSVWGGYRDSNGLPVAGNGSIRMATWTFNDMTLAKALVAAHRRGVSVQVIAAVGPNKDFKPWKYLKKNLGQRYYKAGVASSSDKVSFARECRGACRGRGGVPHAKYFLFDNVGPAHTHGVVMQTSMNLTRFATVGQWNQAQTVHNTTVYAQFLGIFREARLNQPQGTPYRRYQVDNIASIFFPLPGANANSDPVMQALNQTRCTGATGGGTSSGRTQIRVIQYAIYDNRGLWIAKKLRSLWNAGCDVQIIYSLATRPVLSILRNGSGRGAIPMRQSVVKKGREIVKYNHSKWMTITGNWGPSTASYITFSGSANWSNVGLNGDEQMQQISDYTTARAHMATFNTTWRQKTSRAPSAGGGGGEGRELPIEFGKGEYKNMTPFG